MSIACDGSDQIAMAVTKNVCAIPRDRAANLRVLMFLFLTLWLAQW
jgi:hypothetical protein